jgi:hypothetical protein
MAHQFFWLSRAFECPSSPTSKGPISTNVKSDTAAIAPL